MHDDPFDRALARERAERRTRRHRTARAVFGHHARTYVVVNLTLVALWAIGWWLRGDFYPWVIYPIVGWGVGLAMHYVAVRPAFREVSATDGDGQVRL
jgi:hypothetical protein